MTRLGLIAKRFRAIERDSRGHLERAGIATSRIDDSVALQEIERMKVEGREGKRRRRLYRELFTLINARRLADLLDGVQYRGHLDILELITAIDAAYFAGVNSLRTDAEIGLAQRAVGTRLREKTAQEKRVDAWLKHDAELRKTVRSQHKRAKMIAEESHVSHNTVRAALLRRTSRMRQT